MNNLDASVNNTPYSENDLDHFKELLVKANDETKEEIDNLKASLEDLRSNDQDEYSSVAHHQGDVGSEEEEKETLYRLLERNNDKLKEINAALDRIANGTYGVCEDTGEQIQKERLEAIPYARYNVKARKKDEGRNTPPKV